MNGAGPIFFTRFIRWGLEKKNNNNNDLGSTEKFGNFAISRRVVEETRRGGIVWRSELVRIAQGRIANEKLDISSFDTLVSRTYIHDTPMRSWIECCVRYKEDLNVYYRPAVLRNASRQYCDLLSQERSERVRIFYPRFNSAIMVHPRVLFVGFSSALFCCFLNRPTDPLRPSVKRYHTRKRITKTNFSERYSFVDLPFARVPMPETY